MNLVENIFFTGNESILRLSLEQINPFTKCDRTFHSLLVCIIQIFGIDDYNENRNQGTDEIVIHVKYKDDGIHCEIWLFENRYDKTKPYYKSLI